MLIKNHFGLNRVDGFLLTLQSIMIHPIDAQLMKGNFCKNYLNYGIDELGIEKDPPFFIFNTARKYTINNFSTHNKHGFTAGMIFLNLLDMQHMGVEELSFDKALYILLTLDNKYAVDINNEKPIKSETTLRDVVWKTYKSVAHLWAAYILVLEGIYSTSNLEESPFSYLALIYEFQNRFKKMNLGFEIHEIENPQIMVWDIRNPFQSIPFDVQILMNIKLNSGVKRLKDWRK